MESIIVKEVNEETTPKSGKKLWRIELEDDNRELVTFNEKIAQAAFQSKGSESDALVQTKQNGNFTNYYLNAINNTTDDKPAPVSKQVKKTGEAVMPGKIYDSGKNSAAVQDRIARQWAYGRATELLAAMGDYDLPLTTENQSVLEETAKWLLSQTK